MTEPQGKTVQRNKKHAAIYFNAGSSEVMKELAARIRSEGGKTTLIWSDRWQGPENLLMEVKAVVIEIDCANAEEIKDSYLKFSENVEVHFVDHFGEFVEEPGSIGAAAIITSLGKANDPDVSTEANGLADAFEDTKEEIEMKAMASAGEPLVDVEKHEGEDLDKATEPEGTDAEAVLETDPAISEQVIDSDRDSESSANDSAGDSDTATEDDVAGAGEEESVSAVRTPID